MTPDTGRDFFRPCLDQVNKGPIGHAKKLSEHKGMWVYPRLSLISDQEGLSPSTPSEVGDQETQMQISCGLPLQFLVALPYKMTPEDRRQGRAQPGVPMLTLPCADRGSGRL